MKDAILRLMSGFGVSLVLCIGISISPCTRARADMAKDTTGKNIDILKTAYSGDVACLIDIMASEEEQVEDVFTESGGTPALDLHEPIRSDGGAGALPGSIWRADTGSLLSIDSTNDRVYWNGTGGDAGHVLDARSSDGVIEALITGYDDGGSKEVKVGIRFRASGIDSAAYYLVELQTRHDQVVLYRYQNSTLTQVDTGSVSLGSAGQYLAKASFSGSTIKVYVDNVLLITATDETVNQYQTYIGLYQRNAGSPTAAEIDNAYATWVRFTPAVHFADRSIQLLTADYLYDTATEASDTPLESHTPDIVIPGGAWLKDSNSLLKVSGGVFYWNGNATSLYDGHMINAYLADGAAQFVSTPWDSGGNSRSIFLKFRYNGINGTGFHVGILSDADQLVLYKENPTNTRAAVATNNATYDSQSSYFIRAVWSGSSILIYVDGILRITHTDSFNQSEGHVGLHGVITGTGGTPLTEGLADNFIAGPFRTYTSIIPEGGLGEIDISGPAGGGLAQIADTQASILNQGQFSSAAEATGYYKGKTVCEALLLIDGTETAQDVLPQFTGRVKDVREFTIERFTLECEASMLYAITAFPRDVVDLGIDPNAPIDARDNPIVVPFGNHNDQVRPLCTSDSDVRGVMRSPLTLIDIFLRRYIIHGTNNTLPISAGDIVYYDEQNRQWISAADGAGDINDGTAKGRRYADLLSNVRNLWMDPIRAGSSNTFTDWYKVVDGAGNTKITIDDGSDLLEIGFGGSPNRGVISSLTIYVTMQGSVANSLSYVVKKAGSIKHNSTLSTTSRAQQQIALTVSDWSAWDLNQMTLELSQNTGSTDIWAVYVEITHAANEVALQSELPIFGAVTGYQDKADRYADGAVISSDGETLRNPAKIFQAIARDRHMGWNQKVDRINTTRFSEAITDTASYYFDFVLTERFEDEEAARDWLGAFLSHAHLAGFLDFMDRWVVDYFDSTDDPVAFFSLTHNIAVENPDADPEDHRDSFRRLESDPFYNNYVFYHAWSDALGRFTETEKATGLYLVSGVNGSTNSSPGTTFTATGQTFQDDNILAGHKVYVRSGGGTVGIYTIATVDSQTQLTLETSPGNSLSGLEFYVGAYLNATCVESYLTYGEISTFPRDQSELRHVVDRATVQAILAQKIPYHAFKKNRVGFETNFHAIHLEYRDFVYVDHPFLPPSTQKEDTGGTITTSITASATSIAVTGTAPATGDIIQVENELMDVTSGGASPITVTRGFASTLAAAHDGSTTAITIYRMVSKWEVLKIREQAQSMNPYRLECREV